MCSAEALVRAEEATAEKIAASRRVVRRTILGILASLTLALLAGGLAIYANSEKRRAEASAAQADISAREAREQSKRAHEESIRADKFINLVSSNPAGLRAMEKICLDASSVTARLATTRDNFQYRRAEERFWELYYGPMYIIEIHQAKESGLGHSKIEASMVGFGKELSLADTSAGSTPSSTLSLHADAVREECLAYLKFLRRTRQW